MGEGRCLVTLDRTGEPVEEEPPPHTEGDECNGWLGEDHEGRPIPCVVHRPHLDPKRLRYRAGVLDYPELP